MGDRMFPPGHTRVTEYRIVGVAGPGTPIEITLPKNLSREAVLAELEKYLDDFAPWAEPPHLEQRTVLTTPWQKEDR